MIYFKAIAFLFNNRSSMPKPSFLKLTLVLVAALAIAGAGYALLNMSQNQIQVSQPEVNEPATRSETKEETPEIDTSEEVKRVDEQLPATPITPTPNITPTPTPAVIPKLPVIHLSYGGQAYDGLLSSSCWPTKESHGVGICSESPLQGPSTAIPIATDTTSLTVEIEAAERPIGVSALIFKWVEGPFQQPLQIIHLGPALTAPLDVELPVGYYLIEINGQWPIPPRDVSPYDLSLRYVAYTFKIDVEQR